MQPQECSNIDQTGYEQHGADLFAHGEINNDDTDDTDHDGEEEQEKLHRAQLSGCTKRDDTVKHRVARDRLLERGRGRAILLVLRCWTHRWVHPQCQV